MKYYDIDDELEFIHTLEEGITLANFERRFINVYGFSEMVRELAFRTDDILFPDRKKEGDDLWAEVGVDPSVITTLEYNSYLILNMILIKYPIEDYPEKWL